MVIFVLVVVVVLIVVMVIIVVGVVFVGSVVPTALTIHLCYDQLGRRKICAPSSIGTTWPQRLQDCIW